MDSQAGCKLNGDGFFGEGQDCPQSMFKVSRTIRVVDMDKANMLDAFISQALLT
jgi:hypothetical protein